MKNAQQTIQDLLSIAGVEIDGTRPFDVRVHRPEFYDRVLGDGVIGFGESYMAGWWDCEALDELIHKLLRADLEHAISPVKLLVPVVLSKVINRQRRSRAFKIGEHHYDLGNDLFQRMLDKRMTYTCGYWRHASDLDAAQEAKLDLVCRKIGLKPGMKILDIGCGWGSFVRFAAERYQVQAVGITVAAEQIELGRQLCEGLPVDLRLQDYRDVTGTFDRIVSLGMFEHVGVKNYRAYIKRVCRGCFCCIRLAPIRPRRVSIRGPTNISSRVACYRPRSGSRRRLRATW
jgi:cyclopropane-fatty-acyl-phospholipid synthase